MGISSMYTVEFLMSIVSQYDSMCFMDKMSNDVAQMFLPRNAVASDRNIGYKKREKEGEKRYHPCVSEPRSRARG